MSRPPQTTLVLGNVSSLTIIGIDTQFFMANELIRGIKVIPEGHHFFHYSESTETGEAIRYGHWFSCDDGDIISVEFSEDSCVFTHNANPIPTLSTDYAYMVAYPESLETWTKLTKYVDAEALWEYCPPANIPILTATPLKEENMVLLETLHSRDSNQKFEDQTDKELKYTILQFKLSGPRSSSDEVEVTRNFLEKSWYLTQLFGHDPELLLAEIQISFLHFIILGNLCSCTQWLMLLKLVLMSSRFLLGNMKFAQEFLGLLVLQLDKLPTEYMSSLDIGVVDMKTYTEVMEDLSYIRINDITWSKIRELNRHKFSFDLSFHKKIDADNFEVYDMDDYDEDDEDAPAVVM